MRCEHKNFDARVSVNRLEDGPGKVGAFVADVAVHCIDCGTRFQFLGLDQGLNIGGAAVSYDRTEAHLTISPDGLPPTSGVRGFSIKSSGGQQS